MSLCITNKTTLGKLWKKCITENIENYKLARFFKSIISDKKFTNLLGKVFRKNKFKL